MELKKDSGQTILVTLLIKKEFVLLGKDTYFAMFTFQFQAVEKDGFKI